MSFLYRHALFVSRKRPYLDWANQPDDGEIELTDALSHQKRTVYLVPETMEEPDLEALLDEFWEEIFAAELSAWVIDEARWPQARTRQIFEEWFDVELNDAVYDLTPEEPLTQAQVDLADLAEVSGRCAGCGMDVDEGEGRWVGFTVPERGKLDVFQGRVFPLQIGDEEVVYVIVSPEDSEEARAGKDLLLRVCSSGCEKSVRKIVPKALRDWSKRLEQAFRLNQS
jgi:hypothetical protein